VASAAFAGVMRFGGVWTVPGGCRLYTVRMDELAVSPAGLYGLAAECGAVSAGLASATPPPRVGPAAQATSAAVGSAYAAIGPATATLAGRVEIFGANVGSADTDFVTQEGSAAERLAGVARVIPT
jgi:hypothetical protein